LRNYIGENNNPMRIWSNHVSIPHTVFEFMARIDDLFALRCYLVLIHEVYESGERSMPVEVISELSKLNIGEVYKGMIWLEKHEFIVDGKLLFEGDK
jgi:hypothetical protein